MLQNERGAILRFAYEPLNKIIIVMHKVADHF